MPAVQERIVFAAMALFHERGYNLTTLGDIAEAAECHRGSVQRHFATKERVLCAVLEEYERILDPVLLGPVRAEHADPIARIFGLLEGYRMMLADSAFAYGCPIGNLALEPTDTSPAVRERIAANFKGWCEGVAGWLAEAEERFVPGTDFMVLAQFILTVMEGAVMQARAFHSLEPYDRSVAQLRRHVESLMRDPHV